MSSSSLCKRKKVSLRARRFSDDPFGIIEFFIIRLTAVILLLITVYRLITSHLH